MPLLPDKIDEFVNLTLDNFKRRSWVDISLDLQHYEFASRLFAKKGKVPEKGGVQLNFKVQHTNTGTAKHSELYDTDTTSVIDLTTEGKVPWTKQTVNFSYDIDEDVFQTDLETIVREVQVREHAMYNDFFELMETAMWTAPSSSTLSPRTPYGIPLWIQKDATTTPGGAFNGGNPASGWASGLAEIDSDVYTNWKNWTYGYTQVSREDLVERWRKACRFIRFLAPHSFPELGKSSQSDYAHYTTNAVIQPLEKLLESRNDNLGPDVAKYMNSVVFKGNPVIWVPYLDDNDSTDPVYSVNWKVLHYFFRKGRHMRRGKPIIRDPQHTVRVVHMDNWGNFACYNRRALAVGSTS